LTFRYDHDTIPLPECLCLNPVFCARRSSWQR
jgi:hypothetical protein